MCIFLSTDRSTKIVTFCAQGSEQAICSLCLSSFWFCMGKKIKWVDESLLPLQTLILRTTDRWRSCLHECWGEPHGMVRGAPWFLCHYPKLHFRSCKSSRPSRRRVSLFSRIMNCTWKSKLGQCYCWSQGEKKNVPSTWCMKSYYPTLGITEKKEKTTIIQATHDIA